MIVSLLVLGVLAYVLGWVAVLTLPGGDEPVLLEGGSPELLTAGELSKKDADSAGIESAPALGSPTGLGPHRLVVLMVLALSVAMGVGMLAAPLVVLSQGLPPNPWEIPLALLSGLALASPALFLGAGARRALRQDTQRRLLRAAESERLPLPGAPGSG